MITMTTYPATPERPVTPRLLPITACHQCKHITRSFMDVRICELTGSVLFSWRNPSNPPPPIPDDCKLKKAPEDEAGLDVRVAEMERLRDD